MSYRALAWAVEQDVPSTHAFAVLCALAGYAGDTGECWPSQAALSAKTKQTDRSVRNQIAALVESGHIEKAIVQGRPGFRLLIDRNSVPADRNHIPPEGNGVPDTDAAKPETGSSPPEPVSADPEPYSAEPVTESGRKKILPPCPPGGRGHRNSSLAASRYLENLLRPSRPEVHHRRETPDHRPARSLAASRPRPNRDPQQFDHERLEGNI